MEGIEGAEAKVDGLIPLEAGIADAEYKWVSIMTCGKDVV